MTERETETRTAISGERAELVARLAASERARAETVEQQAATGEILRAISESPAELASVLAIVAECAARLCRSQDALIYRVDGETLRPEAHYGPLPGGPGGLDVPVSRGAVVGRAVTDRRTVHVHDLAAESEEEFPIGRAWHEHTGQRTTLATPLLRGGVPIGAILIRRTDVRPFTQSEIRLLETFAHQAVIAVENARLLQELSARTAELARSVDELEALGEIGQTVGSSLHPAEVLQTILSHAVELSGADVGSIYEFDADVEEFRLRAAHGLNEDLTAAIRGSRLALAETVVGRAALRAAPVEIPDIRDETIDPLSQVMERAGYRALLAVPLLREGRIVGGLIVRKKAAGRFADGVAQLLERLATQSVLAIENARHYAELEDKSRQLEVASQHKSQFLANMSHELRTPLNAILGYTELIIDGIYGEPPERIREVLERVETSGRHLLELINDVLDVSKMEAGQLTLSLQDYSLEEVVQAVYAALEPLAAEKGLALRAAIDPDLPAGRGDERRISQVLVNLVGNAIKFTESGEVAVHARVDDDAFVVSVRDTGPGISAADQEKLFREFQQLDSSSTRGKGGTGLGLAIVKRIVAVHGGRVWVESRVGSGATFAFMLPVHVERQVDA
jgi:signal transduction histidine kinase/putative methionine-R-sulfoxide reductase with GAF domain